MLTRDDLSAPLFNLAREFAEADSIIVAAPYWDLSFPAAVKQYLEQVSVVGVTFTYSEEGVPVGLCQAKKLYYVTTAGGKILSREYGYGYVRALAQSFFGISETLFFGAEGLDLPGADVQALLMRAKAQMDAVLKE